MPRLKPGAIIAASQPLPLSKGERLTLVADDGTIVHVEGPASGPPVIGQAAPAGEDGVVQALSRLFSSDRPPAAKGAWGGFRGDQSSQGHEPGPAEVWAWNVSRSDSICVPASIEPSLWRADATGEQGVSTIRQVAWMSDAGCFRQARMLVKRLQ